MALGIYVGRFCPIHLGHQRVIEKVLECENHIILIGSCNEPQSFRNLFSYSDRKRFIKTLYPNACVIGIPDFNDDEQWIEYLFDVIKTKFYHLPIPPSPVIFFGGCVEDMSFFVDKRFSYEIINRFDQKHSETKISATEVRDGLIMKKNLEGLIDTRIHEDVVITFNKAWEEFRKK